MNKDLSEVLGSLNGKILDVGCGRQPYRSFLPATATYVGMDIQSVEGVDHVYPVGGNFPFQNGVFDAVLCTQVLEHAEDGQLILDEIRRVLKPGGVLVVSVPFIYQLHGAPHDYFRFSEYGAVSLLENFSVKEVRKQGGVGSTLAVILLCWLYTQLDRNMATWAMKVLLLPFLIALSFFINMTGLLLDKIDTTEALYGNVLIIALNNAE
ncbi:MAG: methyltransferase domain-containing protein [Desulfovibrio sp.]